MNGLFNGLADKYSDTSLIFLSSLSSTVFMINPLEVNTISICLEGFLYGNISVLFALTCTLAIKF